MPSSNLTRIPGQPTASQVLPGMAHFAATGPDNTHCGKCQWFRPSKAAHKGRCEMYFKLVGKDGEVIDSNYDSCKYFETKPLAASPLFDR